MSVGQLSKVPVVLGDGRGRGVGVRGQMDHVGPETHQNPAHGRPRGHLLPLPAVRNVGEGTGSRRRPGEGTGVPYRGREGEEGQPSVVGAGRPACSPGTGRMPWGHTHLSVLGLVRT